MKRLLITILLISSLFGQEWVQWPVTEYTDLAFHPDSSHILYLGTGSNFGSQRSGALMVSYDSGNTLDTLFGNLSIVEIEFHPFSPDTLYLGLASTNNTRPGVLKVTRNEFDYDSTYVDAGIRLWADRSVTAIEIDPISPDTMFAGTAAFGAGHMWRSTNGGQSWNDVNPEYIQDVFFIRQHPANRNEIFYTTGYGTLHRSFDWGETWSESTEWDGDGYPISSITLFPNEPGRILITVIGSGAHISSDYGDSWDNWNQYIPSLMAREIIFAADNPNHIYLATNDSIFFSDDLGNSWSDYTFNFGNVSQGIERLEHDLANNKLFAGQYRYGLFTLDLNSVSIYHKSTSSKIKTIELKVFPNPTNSFGSLHIRGQDVSTITIELYNLLGQRFAQQSITLVPGQGIVSLLDVYPGMANLPSGVYFIRATIQEYTLVSKYMLVR